MSATIRAQHPHKFTLDLLEQVINLAPLWFPPAEHDSLKNDLTRLEQDINISKEDIEHTILKVGKAIWPYRRALFDLHQRYGQPLEEQHLQERAPDALKPKLEEYFREGGTPDDLERGALPFESIFNPEEKQILVDLMLQVHDELMTQFQHECVSQRRDECHNLVDHYHDEQATIEHLIERLRTMAIDSPDWSGEILEKINAFEDGWSLLDREVTREEVEKTLEFYHDLIEGGIL